MTDAELEKKWEEFEDATMVERKNGDLVLASDWWIFKAGTGLTEIWGFFDRSHSGGIHHFSKDTGPR